MQHVTPLRGYKVTVGKRGRMDWLQWERLISFLHFLRHLTSTGVEPVGPATIANVRVKQLAGLRETARSGSGASLAADRWRAGKRTRTKDTEVRRGAGSGWGPGLRPGRRGEERREECVAAALKTETTTLKIDRERERQRQEERKRDRGRAPGLVCLPAGRVSSAPPPPLR